MDLQQRFWFPYDDEGYVIGDVQHYDPQTENLLVQLHVGEGKKVIQSARSASRRRPIVFCDATPISSQVCSLSALMHRLCLVRYAPSTHQSPSQ